MEHLVTLATIAVACVLAVGLYSLWRGGDFSRNYSNRLMRLRVLLQAVAVAIIMLTLYLSGR